MVKMGSRAVAFVLLLLCWMGPNRVHGRTLDEIKKSGNIIFAISEQPTVYQKTEQGTRGFDYNLALSFAKYLGVRAKFVVVNPLDYFKMDIYKNPLLLKEVDIYADHILLPRDFKNLVLFIPTFQSMKVCIHSKKIGIGNVYDLPRLKTCVAESEDMRIFDSVEKKTGQPLQKQTVSGVEEQIRNLQIGSIDYLILDSDQAFYYSRKFTGLAVNVDILKELAEIYDIGWVTSKENTALKKEATDMFNTVKSSGDFYKLWEQVYDISYDEYRDVMKLIEQKGDELFRKGLDYAFNKQYEDSIALFQNVKKMKLASEKIQRLYDTIYIDWMRSSSKLDMKKQIAIVDKYMRSDPSDYFINFIKEKNTPLYRSYVSSLKAQRDDFLKTKQITNAIEIQSIISILNPNVQAEKQIYDDIYISMLQETESKSQKDGMTLLDDYIKEKPSAYFFKELKSKLPVLFDDYMYKLKAERDSAVRMMDVDRAQKLQETIAMMNPDSFDEANTLSLLKLKSENRNQKNRKGQASSSPNTEPAQEDIVMAGNANLDTNKIRVQLNPGQIEPGLSNALAQGEKGIENYEGERFFQLGVMNMNNKNYDDALNAFQSAKSLNYQVNECVNYIQQIIEIMNKQAKEQEDKKINDFNDYFGKAISFYLKEDYSQALENILACLNIFPDNQEARKYSEIISDNLRAEGEKTINESSPYFLYYLNRINTAEGLLNKKDYNAAKKIYEEILTIFPNNEFAKQKLITCLYKLNPASLEKVLKEYFNGANNLLTQKKYREAYIQFSFIKKVNPKYPDIDSYIEKSRTTKLELPKGVKPKDFNYDAVMSRAISAYEKGELQQALALYRRILGYYPDDYKALVNSSRIENMIQSRKNVTTEVSSVSSGIREKAENYYLKGQFFYRIQDYKKALKMWEESYRIDPTFRKAFIDIKRVKKMMSYFE